jgi:hypothetical protein
MEDPSRLVEVIDDDNWLAPHGATDTLISHGARR